MKLRRLLGVIVSLSMILGLYATIYAPTAAAACSNLKIVFHEDANQQDNGGTLPYTPCYANNEPDMNTVGATGKRLLVVARQSLDLGQLRQLVHDRRRRAIGRLLPLRRQHLHRPELWLAVGRVLGAVHVQRWPRLGGSDHVLQVQVPRDVSLVAGRPDAKLTITPIAMTTAIPNNT
jgi:hypothetical protein